MISHIIFDPSPYKRIEERKRLEALLLNAQHYIVLDTCDRLELFMGNGDIPTELRVHLSKMAAGMLSPMLGEKAIMGQIRLAYKNAISMGTISKPLHKLFQEAIKIGRMVRTRTNIDKGAIGHGQAVVDILKSHKTIEKPTILLIGVNELTQAIIKFLSKISAVNIVLANRSIDKARELTKNTEIKVDNLSNLSHLIPNAQIIISGTHAPHFIVKKTHFPILETNPKFVFDLSNPPDIEEEVKHLDYVTFFGLAEIEHFVEKNHTNRQKELGRATELIMDEIKKNDEILHNFVLKKTIA